jgi:hypothetical protein
MTSTEFWSGWWWPAATAVLGFVFAGLVFSQWLKRHKPHQMAWTVGLLMYAVAALMEAVSEGMGFWNPLVYRFYIVLAASMVGFLGLGTYYLMARKKTGPKIFLAYVLICFATFFVGVFTTTLNEDKLIPGITVGGQALGASMSFPRFMSLFFNIPGTLLLLGGAVVSAYRFAKKHEYAYRMWANVLIALGTIVIAWAGSMARAGQTVGLYPAEMVASAILLSGFLLAGTLDKGAKAAVASGRERRAQEQALNAEKDASEENASVQD